MFYLVLKMILFQAHKLGILLAFISSRKVLMAKAIPKAQGSKAKEGRNEHQERTKQLF